MLNALKPLVALTALAISAPSFADCSEYALEKQFETSLGTTYLRDVELVCTAPVDPEPGPEPEFSPTLSVNPEAIVGPEEVLVTWDTDGDRCDASAPGVIEPVELRSGGALRVRVTGPIEFKLDCDSLDAPLVAPVMFTPVDPEPPVQPPVFQPSSVTLPASGGWLSFDYNTRGFNCSVSGSGVQVPTELSGEGSYAVPVEVNPPATYTLTCPGLGAVVVLITAEVEVEPPAPPVPPVPGEYAGVPEYPWQPVYSSGTIAASSGMTNCVGTRENPAVIMGGSVTGTMQVQGDHCVIDGVSVTGGAGRLIVSGDHVIIRNVFQSGHTSRNGMLFSASNSLIENSTFERNQGADKHGINLGCNVSNVWVGNNDLRYNGGQGMQTGHNCPDRNYPDLPAGVSCGGGPDLVYTYGNRLHNNREGGAATKRACRMIWSGNTITGHRVSSKGSAYTFDNGDVMSAALNGSGGAGYGIAIGAAGATSYTAHLGNSISNNNICSRVEEMTTKAGATAPVAMFIDEDCDGTQDPSYRPSSSPNGYNFDKNGGFIPFCDSRVANVSVGFFSAHRPFNFTISREGGSVMNADEVKAGNALTYQEKSSCDRGALEARFQSIFGHGW